MVAPDIRVASRNSDDSIIEDTGIMAAQDRAHKSGERAAQQFVKLLGTLLGGLGLAIAAWLQRLFELSWQTPITPLAWFLVIALGFVALGLITLVLTAILDQASANHFSDGIGQNHLRMFLAKERQSIAQMVLGPDKSALELANASKDEDAVRKIATSDARANTLNKRSVWLGIGAWGCLISAFITLGAGIVVTIIRVMG